MYAQKLKVLLASPAGVRPCPLRYLDSFAMRSFTGESRFDDTLPAGEGLLEAGAQVPVEALRAALEGWFRRKSYLKPGESVQLEPLAQVR